MFHIYNKRFRRRNLSQLFQLQPSSSQPMYPLQTTPVHASPSQTDTKQIPPASQRLSPSQPIDLNMTLQSIIANMNTMNGKLESLNNTNNFIQQKLQKLDILEEINKKLITVEENITQMKTEINDIKNIQEQQAKTIQNEERHHHEIEDRMRYLEGQNRKLEVEKNEIYEQFLQFQTHSMKYNLIFTGLNEAEDESREQTEHIVKTFIDKELEIENANDIQFQNVHRLKLCNDGKPRSIIARFINYSDHQRVLREASLKLKLNPQHSVYQQYPQEMSERQRALVPKLKEFQRRGQNAKNVYDQLIVNQQRYIPEPHGDPHIPGQT